MAVPTGDLTRLAERLARRPLVLLLDVDGTLAPIAPRPEDAVVPAETRAVIGALGREPGVHVALVSGRAAADARRMVGVDSVWAIGNHGFETIAPGGEVLVDQRVAPYRDRLASAAERLREMLAGVPGALVEDKLWTLSVHYRRVDEGDVPRIRDAVERVAEETGLRAMEGKKILELRPPVDVNKGTASVSFVRQIAGSAEPAVLYAGDDRTDEDAFVALRREVPDAVTVLVAAGNDDAHRATAAEVVLPDVAAVRALLEQLLATR